MPSDNEDEAMGDTSSQDEGKDDIDRPSAGEDESRLTRVKPPNNILGSGIWSIYDEYEDPFSTDETKNDTNESSNNEDVSRSTQAEPLNNISKR